MWLLFWRHVGRHFPQDQKHSIQSDIGYGEDEWNSLYGWVKADWAGEVTYLAASPEAPPRFNAGAGAFSIARKVKLMGGTWENVADMLQDYKVATGGFMEWKDSDEGHDAGSTS